MTGVYVHIPFCAHRCDYCDFATWTDRGHLVDAYVDALVTDLQRRSDAGMPVAETVFFGGGTPSLLPAAGLVRVLDAITRAPGAEVTVECNPDAVDPAKLAAYRAGGVNRISLGVQSTRSHVLAGLGRTHAPASVPRAVGWAREAGFDRVNLDVIYGTPGETTDDWRATLEDVLALEPEHVSAYALTVEPGTPLGRRVANGAPAPDEDLQADAYLVADEMLGAAGLEWYEISNWARPGEECRHNLGYWRQGDYVGVGCAAHGHTAGRRWWNVRTPDRYIALVDAGESTEAGHEDLDADAQASEALVLALRTRDGCRIGAQVAAEVSGLTEDGLVRTVGGCVVLTRRGRLLANAVTRRLLDAGAGGRGAVPAGDDPEPAGRAHDESELLGTR